ERLGASTDREAFARRRCLGGSAADRQGERDDSGSEFETKLTPGGQKTCNGRFDEMKINFHAGNRAAAVCESQSAIVYTAVTFEAAWSAAKHKNRRTSLRRNPLRKRRSHFREAAEMCTRAASAPRASEALALQ